MKTIGKILAAMLLMLAWLTPALAEKRVALLLGNNAYLEVQQLAKAVNDATALEKKLKALGFEVILGTNLTRRNMVSKIQELASRVNVGDKVVFFFAGHGVQIDHSNYLLATDIPATSGIEEEFVRFEGFDVQQIIDMIRHRGAQTTIMILDACRNNPFETTEVTRAIGGVGRGLVPIRKVNEGTFIIYSADEGQQAFDSLGENDTSDNSVFTRSLLTLLDKPDLKLTDMAKKVRLDVHQTVRRNVRNKRQEPFYVDRLFGDFYFHPRKRLQTDEELFWNSIKSNTAAASFKVYLQVYPDGRFKTEAKKKVQELGFLPLRHQGVKVSHAGLLTSQSLMQAGAVLGKVLGDVQQAISGAPTRPVTKVAVKNRQQVFPNSSNERLKDSDLKQLSCLELWLARNEIYDRNGYCFTTALGIQYFDNSNCRTTSTNLKSWTENRNVALIKKWEQKKRCLAK